jgi:hypothetical protein
LEVSHVEYGSLSHYYCGIIPLIACTQTLLRESVLSKIVFFSWGQFLKRADSWEIYAGRTSPISGKKFFKKRFGYYIIVSTTVTNFHYAWVTTS